VCDRLASWAEKRLLRLASNKCSVYRISNHVRIVDCKKSNYKFGAHVLRWSDKTLDLGVMNFNSHVSTIVHKAHVRISLILRIFVDPVVLTQALSLMLGHFGLWSPHTVCNINRMESPQLSFTKLIKGVSGMRHVERLACLGLKSLQVRQLKCDVLMCCRLTHNRIAIGLLNNDFWCFQVAKILGDIDTKYLKVRPTLRSPSTRI